MILIYINTDLCCCSRCPRMLKQLSDSKKPKLINTLHPVAPLGVLKCYLPLRKVAVLNGGGLISVYALSLGTADFISM